MRVLRSTAALYSDRSLDRVAHRQQNALELAEVLDVLWAVLATDAGVQLATDERGSQESMAYHLNP
jgi:hypothetical protein